MFITVWQQAGTYRPEAASPLAWLMMLAHRRAVDRVRTETLHTQRITRAAVFGAGAAYDEVTEAVLDRTEVAALLVCLPTLTGLQRQAITMAFYDGMTYQQVAQHLGIPTGTAKSRIRDGLLRLRHCLDAETPQSND